MNTTISQESYIALKCSLEMNEKIGRVSIIRNADNSWIVIHLDEWRSQVNDHSRFAVFRFDKDDYIRIGRITKFKWRCNPRYVKK